MKLKFLLIAAVFAGVLQACTTDTPVAVIDEAYIARRDSILLNVREAEQDFYLQIIGLFPLDPMIINTFGSDESGTIVISVPGTPGQIGAISFYGDSLVFDVTGEWPIADAAGNQAAHYALTINEYGNSETLIMGRLMWTVKKLGNNYYLRVWDKENPAISAFKGPEWYEPTADYILRAQYTPFATPKVLKVPTSMSYIDDVKFVGAIRFNWQGSDYELNVQEGGFLMFADKTSGVSTYGSGRYMDLVLPAEGGEFVLDFNYAYNPPCSYSIYTTCRFPSKENWLPFEVLAGEKYDNKH